MSALRDAVETNNASRVSVHKRIDALLLALADVYAKHFATMAYLDSESSEDEVKEAIRTMTDRTGADGIFQAVAKLEAHSPERIAAFDKDLRAHKVGAPNGDLRYFGTDRSPRRRTAVIDGMRVPIDDEGIPRDSRF